MVGTTVATAVAQVIEERSSAVFGLMGNGNAHVVAYLTARGSGYTSVRHEAGAVAAAHAYFLATGRIATATTTYGAGFTNTMTALAEARLARIPLVLVTGDAPAAARRWWDVDQWGAARALDVSTLHVTAQDAAAVTAQAFDQARRERTPVVLAIPFDLATSPSPAPVEDDERAGEPTAADDPPVALPAAEDLTEAVRLLSAAERPLVLAGRGAHLAGAREGLTELGDALGAVFATSVMADGLIDSPFTLGVAGGFSREPVADVIAAADVVLVVGMSLNDFQMRQGTLLAGAQHVIQVDIAFDPTHRQVTRYLRGDGAATVEALRDLLPRDHRPARWRSELEPARLAPAAEAAEHHEVCADGRLDPRAVALRLGELLPANRCIVQDGGHFIGWLPGRVTVPDPGAMLLVGTAYQTIGLGFASGVGAAVGRPNDTIALITGDGGGLMALADLVSFVRTARSAVVVVFNDAAYGAELHQYGAAGLDETGMVIDEVDFAALGRAVGAQAHTITALDQLDVLARWVADGAEGVLVLDVAISRDVVADFIRPIGR